MDSHAQFFWCARNRTVSEQPILKPEHFQVSRFRKRQLKGEHCKLLQRGPGRNLGRQCICMYLGWEIAASGDEIPSLRAALRAIRNCCTALSYALRGRAAAQLRGNVGWGLGRGLASSPVNSICFNWYIFALSLFIYAILPFSVNFTGTMLLNRSHHLHVSRCFNDAKMGEWTTSTSTSS